VGIGFLRLRRRAREASDDWRNPSAAVPVIRDFLTEHPADEGAWLLLAETLSELGRLEEAELAARAGLDELDYQDMDLWRLLVDVLIGEEKFDEAEALAEQERVEDDDAAWPHELLARIAWERGDRDAWTRHADEAFARLRGHTERGMLELGTELAMSDHPDAFFRATFYLDRVGLRATTPEGWKANLALGVLWEGLDDELSRRYFERATRYADADPAEEEELLAGYYADLEALRASATDGRAEDVPGAAPL
jgi:tetratricopeptide (TPR) repeat protein